MLDLNKHGGVANNKGKAVRLRALMPISGKPFFFGVFFFTGLKPGSSK